MEQREIYRAIGELAYVVAKAGDGTQFEEKEKFMEIIQEELEDNSWYAESRFEVLDETVTPTLEHAYNEAIHDFKSNKSLLTEELKKTILRVVNAVACAYHPSEIKDFIIDRLEKDLKYI